MLASSKVKLLWDVPGGPVFKNPPSSAGVGVKTLVRELRFHMWQGN